MSDEEQQVSLRPVTEKRFVQAMIVRMDDGTKVSVPTTLDANRARNQILAARVTDLFTKQISEMTAPDKDGAVQLKPKELAEIITAAKRLQELNDAAYGLGTGPGAGESPLTGLGKLVESAVEAGAKAASGATAPSLVEQMKQLNALGRKKDAIDIEEQK